LIFVNSAATPEVLDETDREYLRGLVNQLGMPATMRALAITRGVLQSAIAGLTVRRGSLLLIRSAIEHHRNGGTAK